MKLTAESTVFNDDKVQEKFAELVVDADGIRTEVGKKVGNTEVISRINQSAESVKIQANKVEIDGTATFNAIKSNVESTAQAAVDNLEVGGKNLLLQSNNGANYTWSQNGGAINKVVDSEGATYTITSLPASDSWGIFLIADNALKTKIVAGETYTLSYDLKTSDSISSLGMYFNIRQGNGANPYMNDHQVVIATIANKWVHVTNTTTALNTLPSSSTSILYISASQLKDALRSFSIKNIKVEKGNKATDWTPAPEDVQAEIDAKRSVHTLDTSYSYTYANILTYSAEGYSGNWNVESSAGVKVGDTVRLKVTVSNMSRAPVYVVGTVTAINSATSIKMISHGLDTTIIDGEHILTNSIGANQIAANSIGARHLTVSDNTNLVTSNEMIEISLQKELTSAEPLISGGYLVKKNASQENLMLTNYVVNNFKQNDEFYFECYVKAATAGDISIAIWGYDDSNTYISGSYVSKKISATTSEQFFSGTFKVDGAVWTNTVRKYSIGFVDNKSTKSQIYVRKVIVRRKSAGELIVDGSITTDKIAAGAITVGKIDPIVYKYSNAGQGTGYAKLCTISVTENYRNKPIQFTLHSRNKNATAVSWRFLNSNSPSTCTVASATYDGDTALYYVGTGGTYTIYFALGESYDEVRIYDLIMPYDTGLTVAWAGEYYGTSLPSGAVAFTKLAGTRTSAELDNAAKTATTYITDIGNDGIRVHDSHTSNNSIVINSSGMEVFKGGTGSENSVAFYGDTARVGKAASRHIEIKDGGIQIYQDSTNVMGHFGYGPGTTRTNGTSTAPYFTLGKRGTTITTVGNYSVAEGDCAIASGYSSHAEGSWYNITSAGLYGPAGTYYPTASDVGAHAEGEGTLASENGAHAEGVLTVASGSASHAEGEETVASSQHAHAEGNRTQAISRETHAEGYGTIASNDYAHAEGCLTTASGECSHAGGYHTTATRNYQTVIGKYNSLTGSGTTSDPYISTNAAFIIGNGVTTTGKDIFTVDWSGNVNIPYGATYRVNGVSIVNSTTRTTFTPVNGANNSTFGGSYYEKYGNVVHVHVGVSGLTAKTETLIYSLPDGCYPYSTVYAHGTGGAWNTLCYMEVRSNGRIYVRSEGTYCGADAIFII